jgi:hypothetical protein
MFILNRHWGYFAIFGFYLIAAQEVEWRIYGEVFIVLIYAHSVIASKEYRLRLRYLCNLVLLSIFVADKWYILHYADPLNKIRYILLHWTMILLSPVLNNILLTINSPTQSQYFELRQQELYHYSEQHLKTD